MKPNLTLDDGADLIFTVHNKFPQLIENIIGGTEETTTGVHRLRAMSAAKKLLYPLLLSMMPKQNGILTMFMEPGSHR